MPTSPWLTHFKNGGKSTDDSKTEEEGSPGVDVPQDFTGWQGEHLQDFTKEESKGRKKDSIDSSSQTAQHDYPPLFSIGLHNTP